MSKIKNLIKKVKESEKVKKAAKIAVIVIPTGASLIYLGWSWSKIQNQRGRISELRSENQKKDHIIRKISTKSGYDFSQNLKNKEGD